MTKKVAYIAIIFPILLLAALSVFGSKIPTKQQSGSDVSEESKLTKLDSPQTTASSNETYSSPDDPYKINQIKEPPKMQIDVSKKYQAIMTTSEGTIKIELFADKTPITVNNFVSLSKENYYNNVIFHRVLKGFMIQSGDPTGTGSGGPGYKFDDEPFDGEYTKGTVAMANAGPNTNGSQFFIMHADYPLPKNYVIFGKVIEGIETVDKIAEAPVTTNSSGEPSKPVKPAKIIGIEIIENN